MLFLFYVKFMAFPEKNNALLTNAAKYNSLVVDASGSIGLQYGGKCHQTYPNETTIENERLDWCSNIASKDSSDRPWISYSIKNKGMRLTGYAVRNGCCWYPCCCVDDGHIIDEFCCCRLYSFSLQGSNDNKTWTVIHSVEKDRMFDDCQFKTYEFPQTESFKFIRLIQDEEFPGCPKCMQINQIELYGTTTDSYFFSDASEEEENDESVSIIGKIKHY